MRKGFRTSEDNLEYPATSDASFLQDLLFQQYQLDVQTICSCQWSGVLSFTNSNMNFLTPTTNVYYFITKHIYCTVGQAWAGSSSCFLNYCFQDTGLKSQVLSVAPYNSVNGSYYWQNMLLQYASFTFGGVPTAGMSFLSFFGYKIVAK